jgi:HSP20 family protein
MARDNQATGQSSGHQQAAGQSSGQQGQGKQQSSEISQDRALGQQGGQQGYGQNYQRGGQGDAWQRSGALSPRRGGSAVSPYRDYGAGPFSTMRRISDEMDRLFESVAFGRSFFPSEFGSGAWAGYGDQQGASALWAPHVDVVERDGKLLISADLPGVKKEDVKVEVNQDSVILQGQRHQERTSNDRGYFQSERSYGSFYRMIPLPEGVNTESATATFRDGVLQIELPAPSQQSRGRTLEIKGDTATGGTGSTSSGGQQQR